MIILDSSSHGSTMLRVAHKTNPDIHVEYNEVSDSLWCDPSVMAERINWISGPGILCLPWGSQAPNEDLHSSIDSARTRGLYTVAPAGDALWTGDECEYPAAFPGVLAVGSCTRWLHIRSAFSPPSPRIDLLAPGEGWHDGWGRFGKRFRGTCPASVFAGCCAEMVLKIHKPKSFEDLRECLLDYTVPAFKGVRALDWFSVLRLRREMGNG